MFFKVRVTSVNQSSPEKYDILYFIQFITGHCLYVGKEIVKYRVAINFNSSKQNVEKTLRYSRTLNNGIEKTIAPQVRLSS